MPFEYKKWPGSAGGRDENGHCGTRKYHIGLYVHGDGMKSELSKMDRDIDAE